MGVNKEDDDGDSIADETFETDDDDAAVAGGDSSQAGNRSRRAPRALTGRFVRPGTGASKETLNVLRKKLLERLRLKELLGAESSHLYFGALNKQKAGHRRPPGGGGVEAAKKKLAIAL